MNEANNFCDQCGHSLRAGAQFCSGCGRAVAPVYAPPAAVQAPGAWPRRGRGLPWIIAGAVIVAFAGLAGGYFWVKSGERPAPQTAVPAPGPNEPRPEPPARPEAQTAAGPRTPAATAGGETGFGPLPTLPPVSQQSEFPPLPPPPPLDQGEEAALPPLPADPSQNIPTDSMAGLRWPWTSHRLVTLMELSQLSPWDLVLMRNEIYARHGWVFQRPDLQEYFGRQPWYRPKGTPDNREAANRLAEAELNLVERQNVKAILQYEKAQQGGR